MAQLSSSIAFVTKEIEIRYGQSGSSDWLIIALDTGKPESLDLQIINTKAPDHFRLLAETLIWQSGPPPSDTLLLIITEDGGTILGDSETSDIAYWRRWPAKNKSTS
jgi:hypothetical protein